MDHTRDTDPGEAQEWLASHDGAIEVEGPERANDPKQIVQLEQEFLKRPIEWMRELGEHATQTAQSAGITARPGHP